MQGFQEKYPLTVEPRIDEALIEQAFQSGEAARIGRPELVIRDGRRMHREVFTVPAEFVQELPASDGWYDEPNVTPSRQTNSPTERLQLPFRLTKDKLMWAGCAAVAPTAYGLLTGHHSPVEFVKDSYRGAHANYEFVAGIFHVIGRVKGLL